MKEQKFKYRVFTNVDEEMYNFLQKGADELFISLSTYVRLIIGRELRFNNKYDKEKYNDEQDYS